MILQEMYKVASNIVTKWLRSNGYYNVFATSDVEDIEADSSRRSIYIHIQIKESNNVHSIKPKDAEIKKIKSEANSKHREPWIAVLSTDNSGNVSDEISWVDLQKY